MKTFKQFILENEQATHLKRLGKFDIGKGGDDLAQHVPERKTHMFALHPTHWESTFHSLTLKDPKKIKHYQPHKVDIKPGTLVGDMAIANRFYRAKTPEDKAKHAEDYRKSIKPYESHNVADYKMPELLIPRS